MSNLKMALFLELKMAFNILRKFILNLLDLKHHKTIVIIFINHTIKHSTTLIHEYKNNHIQSSVKIFAIFMRILQKNETNIQMTISLVIWF